MAVSGKNKSVQDVSARLNADLSAWMYKTMLEIRSFEEKVAYFFSRGMIHGTTHLYVGEEATAVGIIAALSEKDLIASTHRGHGHTIAKGIDLNRMMAELLGRETGYCKGKGGSMHIADLTRGHLGANGVVGGGIPIATGAGLAAKMKNIDRIVVSFFGDGAINEGTFHESVNMAAIWDLPVLYVCENNQYGMSMSRHRSIKPRNLADRAVGYGIPGRTVDGNNVMEVYAAALEAREHVRKSGPMLLVCETYRFLGHSKSDANRYRTKKEIADWKKRDPVIILGRYMKEEKFADDAVLAEIEQKAKEDIEKAVEYAKHSPEPSIDGILEDVYA
ncbi:MAG: hypothetical protein B6D68_01210 [spirochete symbiont of Stewartia floridana]|nr:MAG: hypothetical protein B6D68_01210 [spirochete symbiont of Stewartia floridana]